MLDFSFFLKPLIEIRFFIHDEHINKSLTTLCVNFKIILRFLKGVIMHIFYKQRIMLGLLIAVFSSSAMANSTLTSRRPQVQSYDSSPGMQGIKDVETANKNKTKENNLSQRRYTVTGGRGADLLQKREIKSSPLSVSKTSKPMTNLIKECNRNIVVTQDTPSDFQPNAQCIEPEGKVLNTYQANAFLNALTLKKIEVDTRLKSFIDGLSEKDKYVMEAVNAYFASLSSPNNAKNNINFYANIDSKMLQFMFSLCVQSYQNNAFSDNPNNVSSGYIKQQNKLKLDVKNLQGTLDKITKFEAMMIKTLGEDTIIRLQQKRIEIENERLNDRQESSESKGEYGQNLGFETQTTSSQSGFKHQSGGLHDSTGSLSGSDKERGKHHQTETQDIKIRNLAPELLSSIIQQYNNFFKGGKLPTDGSANLEDVEEKLATLKLEAENHLVDTNRALVILSDQRIGEWWAKLDTTFNTLANGFIPIDVFYRNTSGYKDPLIGKGIVNSRKGNTKADIGGDKEFSGILLFKEDESTATAKRDELIIAFSGSNSPEDWKHNLNFFKREGYAQHNLAAGMRVHGGILDSLNESLDEVGTKLKGFFKNYADRYAGAQEMPTLEIKLTGHSLGGALAQLMAVFVKQNIEPYLNGIAHVSVKVYTFGAPPIFTKESAAKAQKMIGKNNIMRVFTIGDPVANMSLISQKGGTSLLMALLNFRHLGLSIPLYDHQNGNEKMASFFDPLNPWKYHLSNRYNNLLTLDAVEIDNVRANQLYQLIIAKGLEGDEIMRQQLDSMINWAQFNESPILTVPGLAPKVLDQLIAGQEKAPVIPSNTMPYYNEIQRKKFSEGDTSEPKLERATTDKVTYNINLAGKSRAIEVKRSTSCDDKNLIKQANLNPNLLSADNKAFLSCGCCLTKNYFVSDDGSTIAKLRGIFGKKISTIPQVMKHCDKYCKPIEKKIFPQGMTVEGMGHIMETLGVGDLWKKKGIKE